MTKLFSEDYGDTPQKEKLEGNITNLCDKEIKVTVGDIVTVTRKKTGGFHGYQKRDNFSLHDAKRYFGYTDIARKPIHHDAGTTQWFLSDVRRRVTNLLGKHDQNQI